MFVLGAILAATVARDNPEKDLANTHQTRHHVSFELTAPDEAVFTVTRDFVARAPGDPIALERQVQLPSQAVVTSFDIQTDGLWRRGRLGPTRNEDQPRSYGGRPSRPWASLAGESFQAFTISTASFRTVGTMQVRYTVWARGEAVPGARRWVYCAADQMSWGEQDLTPDISFPAAHAELRSHPAPERPECLVIEKPEPDGKAPSARYGVYRFERGAWWWLLEVSVPKRIAELPTPPESAPVVFVLDGSRSQEREGGLGPQLALVDAYLVNAPKAEVELVVTSRTAERLFGRFIPASELRAALPADLGKRPLGNGSFLDRGAALAAELLRQDGRPGRIILMTDGVLRSRFDRRATIAALRRAPVGTLVHLLYASAGGMGPSFYHRPPEGLGELPAAFGGASYGVSLYRKDGVLRPLPPKVLRPLVRPEALQSISLTDPSKPSRPDWPVWPPDAATNSVEQIDAGASGVWSGISTAPPPHHLEITGWVWSKKVRLPIRRDPAFDRRLARLAISEEMLMECHDGARQRKDALAEGFVVPGLTFWVPGSGARAPYGVGGFDYPGCLGGASGGGTGGAPPKPQDLVPELGPVLERCGLDVDAGGTIRLQVETDHAELLDVTVEGGDEPDRHCVEEGLWGLRLPDTFNEVGWSREDYKLTLFRRQPTR